MAITHAQAQDRLDAYMAAELAVLQGQEYRIGERLLKRADLAEIRSGIIMWENKVNELAMSDEGTGRGRVARMRPGW